MLFNFVLRIIFFFFMYILKIRSKSFEHANISSTRFISAVLFFTLVVFAINCKWIQLSIMIYLPNLFLNFIVEFKDSNWYDKYFFSN
jgi:hypothetical protein